MRPACSGGTWGLRPPPRPSLRELPETCDFNLFLKRGHIPDRGDLAFAWLFNTVTPASYTES
jgi:hypothetical protein